MKFRSFGVWESLMWGACTAAIATASTAANAQEVAATEAGDSVDEGAEGDVIIVTGIRASLRESSTVKRNAKQIVDVVSAEDVGKFPDGNVAESLQRITGVTIERNAGEGKSITVRGLGPEYNAVLVNGRTMATDNDGREFSFDVLSSDIIQRAEVFKTSTAELPSGGIGATVNIVTARPLDRSDNGLTMSAAGIYEDRSGKLTPDLSAVANWINDAGTFGAVIGVSYVKNKRQLDRSFSNGYPDRSGAGQYQFPITSTGLTKANLTSLPEGARAPQQVVYSREVQDRKRLTVNGSVQFEPSDKLKFTLDGLYTKLDVNALATQFSAFLQPPYINPKLDENGTLTEWDLAGPSFAKNNPGTGLGVNPLDIILQGNNRHAKTYLFGGNVEWNVSDTFGLIFDISKSKAKRSDPNPAIVFSQFPTSDPHINAGTTTGFPTVTNIAGLEDPRNVYYHFAQVAETKVDDDVFEFKVFGEWDAEMGVLSRVTFGGAHSDRTKSRERYDAFGPTVGADIFCAFCGQKVPTAKPGIFKPYDFSGFLTGVDGSNNVPNSFLTASFEDLFRELNSDVAIKDPRRNSLTGADRIASDNKLIALRDSPNADPRWGFYTPAINPSSGFEVNEVVNSVFVNTEWEGEGDLPWSANVGFRIAFTDVTSSGYDQPVISFSQVAAPGGGESELITTRGALSPVSVKNDYVNFLPVANVKFDIQDDMVLRFAFSKTLTRPTLTSLGVNNSYGGRTDNAVSGGGNPNLQAFKSTNYDVSYEWYFGDASWLSVAGFHKEFTDFLETTTLEVPFQLTIPVGNALNPKGPDPITVTRIMRDTRTRNGESGSLSGAELAVQYAFDDRSGFLDGFGAGASYTYVTSNVKRDPGSQAANCGYSGLSPHFVNVSGFYENYGLQARVAYNYRADFLKNCPVSGGLEERRESFGQVDFSIGYEVNDQVTVFVEGVNVTGAGTRDYLTYKNRFSYYEDTGPRYTFGVRASF